MERNDDDDGDDDDDDDDEDDDEPVVVENCPNILISNSISCIDVVLAISR